MHKLQLIRRRELAEFEKGLQEHQNAVTSSGSTVLQNSIMEHNLIAASVLYKNIALSELTQLLGVRSEEQAESTVATMIENARLEASIDQVTRSVIFHDNSAGAAKNTEVGGASKLGALSSNAATLAAWDARLLSLCSNVDQVANKIRIKHPQYAQ